MPERECLRCENKLPYGRRRVCDGCKSTIKTSIGTFVPFLSLRKGDFLSNDTQRYRRIRDHARKVALSHNLLDECVVCGYSTYVETCHRKAIESFSDEALIAEINHPSNLVGLCPNHHWEYDHNIIEVPAAGLEPA